MIDSAADSDALCLTDLEACQPASALSPRPKRHCWRTVAYETETGHMLMAGEESAAPWVTYELGLTGWHRILIGLFPEGARQPFR